MRPTLACPTNERLRGLLAGSALQTEADALTAHLDACPECRRRLESLAGESGEWARLADRLRPTSAGGPALQAVLDELRDPDETCDVEESRPVVPSSLPKRIGPYRVEGLVGQGGMGRVLKAYDPELRRVVAIKVMADALAADPGARSRFKREARAAAAISHEHVITIHGVDEQDGRTYLVMQYIDGPSLQQRIDQSGSLRLRDVLCIGMQVASGLAAAHAQGVIHRDIKPGNILLEDDVERVKITDFGLARVHDDVNVTASGEISGTPAYMSPEQARGDAVDHRADLFSLGAVLYTMCTGDRPFRGGHPLTVLKRVCEEDPRPAHTVNPEVPEWMSAIIGKLMAKHPEDRFATAAEVANLLAQHLAHLQQPASVPRPATVAAPAPQERTEKSWGRRWGRPLVSLTGVALFALFLFFAIAERELNELWPLGFILGGSTWLAVLGWEWRHGPNREKGLRPWHVLLLAFAGPAILGGLFMVTSFRRGDVRDLFREGAALWLLLSVGHLIALLTWGSRGPRKPKKQSTGKPLVWIVLVVVLVLFLFLVLLCMGLSVVSWRASSVAPQATPVVRPRFTSTAEHGKVTFLPDPRGPVGHILFRTKDPADTAGMQVVLNGKEERFNRWLLPLPGLNRWEVLRGKKQIAVGDFFLERWERAHQCIVDPTLSPAERLEKLRGEVRLREKEVKVVQGLLEKKVATPGQLLAVEARSLEASITLASAEKKTAEVVRLLRDLLAKRKQERDLIKKQAEAKLVSQEDLNKAEEEVATVELRLMAAQAEAP